MLKELRIVYEDGTKYTKIVHHTKATIKPIRDKIRHCECGPFKYKVEKHRYLPVSIIRFKNKYMIYPAGIPCIPETTLDDIEVIESNKPKVVVEKPQKPKWMFESSSGDGFAANVGLEGSLFGSDVGDHIAQVFADTLCRVGREGIAYDGHGVTSKVDRLLRPHHRHGQSLRDAVLHALLQLFGIPGLLHLAWLAYCTHIIN